MSTHTNKGSGREAGNCSDNSEYNKLIQHVKKKFCGEEAGVSGLMVCGGQILPVGSCKHWPPALG